MMKVVRHPQRERKENIECKCDRWEKEPPTARSVAQ